MLKKNNGKAKKTISKLKKGDFFKKSNSNKVYIYDGKRVRGYFCYHDANDINTDFKVKKDIEVTTDFEY